MAGVAVGIVLASAWGMEPGASGSRGETSPEPVDTVPAARPTRVLVVDDAPADAKLESIVLRDAGYEVRSAASAEEALVMLEASPVDIIVLDLVLPLMSGMLLASTLRGRHAPDQLTIVAVSAVGTPDVERLSLAAGCTGFLRKPIDPSDFARRVAAFHGERL